MKRHIFYMTIAAFLSLGCGNICLTDNLMWAIAEVESNHNPKAVGKAGERGLYQIMPTTWKDHANGWAWDDAFDATKNRIVAERYLVWIKDTLTKWSGNKPSDEQILAAYNGGIGRLRKVGYCVDKMSKSVRNYVKKVLCQKG